ncbi:MAG: sigma-70 family RNA polymerase sigma factor [Steroidobacteraceae bacterium]
MYASSLPASLVDKDLSPAPNRQAVTRLLSAWRAGDSSALQQLTPLVYEELRQLAHRYMRRERNSHTLQATAVVHEAFVRMVDMEVAWQDRTHFYAVAATLMRRILVDHAKGRQRAKRGGSAQIRSLETTDLNAASPVTTGPYDVLDIDETLEQLAKVDPRMARAVELHYFGGLTCTEIATTLNISEATVHRDLRLAKAWMLKELRPGHNGPAQ